MSPTPRAIWSLPQKIAIASFHWAWRLLLATGDAKHADHMERVLYNGFGAAVATDGQRFFYVNPLQRRVDHFETLRSGTRAADLTYGRTP